VDLPIEIDKDAIAAFCQRHHIIKLALFGSVLTDKFRVSLILLDSDTLAAIHSQMSERSGNSDVTAARLASYAATV
jgi:hypothetical protein